jgi:hypothetical protein
MIMSKKLYQIFWAKQGQKHKNETIIIRLEFVVK